MDLDRQLFWMTVAKRFADVAVVGLGVWSCAWGSGAWFGFSAGYGIGSATAAMPRQYSVPFFVVGMAALYAFEWWRP